MNDQTFLSLCTSSLREPFSPLSFSRSRHGSLAPSSRPCCTRCCMLSMSQKHNQGEKDAVITHWLWSDWRSLLLGDGGQQVPLFALLLLQMSVFLPQLRPGCVQAELQLTHPVPQQGRLLLGLQQLVQKTSSASPPLPPPAMRPSDDTHLLVLALVVLQGGQIGQVALQGLDPLLVLPLQIALLLTFLLQVADVFVSTADLSTQQKTGQYNLFCWVNTLPVLSEPAGEQLKNKCRNGQSF